MPSRPRHAFKHAVHSTLLAFGLTAAAGAGGQTRPQQPPVAPEPFTTLPVRALPSPAIDATVRAMLAAEAPVTRALTAGEKKLLHTLFGDAAPVDGLRLVFDREEQHRPGSGNKAGTLHVHDPRMFSKDYSTESNPYIFGFFVNQMTGVMQESTLGTAWSANDSLSGDLYVVDGRGFALYGKGQQRAMMEDYALRFLHTTRQSYWLSRAYAGDRSTTDPYLITAVETAFPSARKGRVDFQRMILRTLTAGEKKLIRSIFGAGFDTDNIWVHLSPIAYKDVAGAVASGREVYFYGQNRSNDFSNEGTHKLSIFLHEMVHIWQFQTERRHTVTVNDIYEYTIGPSSRFEKYNIEQQAAMLEDYVLYFTGKDRATRWLAKSYSAQELPQRIEYLLRTVEDFLPGARMLRTLAVTEDKDSPYPAENPLYLPERMPRESASDSNIPLTQAPLPSCLNVVAPDGHNDNEPQNSAPVSDSAPSEPAAPETPPATSGSIPAESSTPLTVTPLHAPSSPGTSPDSLPSASSSAPAESSTSPAINPLLQAPASTDSASPDSQPASSTVAMENSAPVTTEPLTAPVSDSAPAPVSTPPTPGGPPGNRL